MIKRILGVVALLCVIGIAALAYALSRDAPCGTAPTLAGKSGLMKAITYRCYGPPEVLKLEEVEKPTPKDDELLVKVHAASVNPLDWHFMRGKPYLLRSMSGMGRPEDPRIGVDFAGTVEAVGKSVTRFKPGDEVFGGRDGAFAEYLVVRQEGAVTMKPSNISFEQAAAVPIAALTALQALRDKGHVHAGSRVLVNGASGGVGTFAVQIAKALGAEVTGVCSTRNLELVRSIGADHVIDYTREDFTQGTQRYDVIVDNVGNHSLLEARHALTADGVLVIVGGENKGDWVGPMTRFLAASMLGPFVKPRKFEGFLAHMNQADLDYLAGLMKGGKLTPVIDRHYTLAELPAAMAYLEKGHARGKVVIDVE
jgi:NADPH:quinone reductase-like Zn-dependent oxidoreductase